MDAERARAMLLGLPHVVETMQWGENLVFWVGDKAIGGRMFALMSLDAGAKHVLSFAATAERQAEMCETEGLVRAPYLARAGWVAAEGWDALPRREWETALTAAHGVVAAKLTRKTQAALALPAKARQALIVERRRALAKIAAEKKPGTRSAKKA